MSKFKTAEEIYSRVHVNDIDSNTEYISKEDYEKDIGKFKMFICLFEGYTENFDYFCNCDDCEEEKGFHNKHCMTMKWRKDKEELERD